MDDVSTWQAAMSIGIGLGLAAAAGFRVFVPLLVLSVAARAGYLPLSAGFEWIGTTPALLAFATATVLEVAAYYVPWLDNALATIAAPTAVVAGVVASASVITELPPLVKWSVAIVGGGLAAGVVAGSTSLVRLKSTAATAGLANPVVATTEQRGASGSHDRLLSMDILPGRRRTLSQQDHGRNLLEKPMTRQRTAYAVGILNEKSALKRA